MLGPYRPRRQGGGSAPLTRMDQGTPLALAYPAVLMELSCLEFEDGEPREPSSLLIFAQDGLLKGMLRDKSNDRVAFVSGVSLEGVLEALEKGLTRSELDWRRDKPSGGRRRQ